MKKNLFFISFFVFLLGQFSFAQNIQIKGKVIDESKVPVADMTVYLSKSKDSTLIQYSTTDDAGLFSINLLAVNEPSFLTFSLIGYQDHVEKFEA